MRGLISCVQASRAPALRAGAPRHARRQKLPWPGRKSDVVTMADNEFNKHNKSNQLKKIKQMKKEKENYERPSMEVIDVRLEGALCGLNGSGEKADAYQEDF